MLLLLAVISGIIYLSLAAAANQQNRALVDNIAGRQPVLVHRYLEEVLLRTNGLAADPAETAQLLITTADALLQGGPVLAVQGNDHQVTIAPATDPTVRAKLTEEARLAHELTALGQQILTDPPGSVTYHRDAAKATDLANLTANVGHDAVGRMSLLADRAVTANSRRQVLLAVAGIVLALSFMWTLSRQIVRRLQRVGDVVRARADGDTSRRYDTSGRDEITLLAHALNAQADHLDDIQTRLMDDADRDGFTNQLVEAFEMAAEEPDAYDVVQRSMAAIAADNPMELLLADSSRAHLKRLAINPIAGAAGCGVQSPYSCVAVRRANPVVFASSTALNACPRLIDRPGGACSAICVPVSFMGKALGVVHTTGPDNQPLGATQVAQISALAAQAGARIGTLRVFQQTQLQANTDALTGLINRRTFETKPATCYANAAPSPSPWPTWTTSNTSTTPTATKPATEPSDSSPKPCEQRCEATTSSAATAGKSSSSCSPTPPSPKPPRYSNTSEPHWPPQRPTATAPRSPQLSASPAPTWHPASRNSYASATGPVHRQEQRPRPDHHRNPKPARPRPHRAHHRTRPDPAPPHLAHGQPDPHRPPQTTRTQPRLAPITPYQHRRRRTEPSRESVAGQCDGSGCQGRAVQFRNASQCRRSAARL